MELFDILANTKIVFHLIQANTNYGHTKCANAPPPKN